MISYKDSVSRRIDLIRYAAGARKESIPKKKHRDVKRKPVATGKIIDIQFRLGMLPNENIWGVIKDLAIKSTAFIMDEILINNTFDKLIAEGASLDEVEKRAIALARSVQPPFEGSPSIIEKDMIDYITTGGKSGKNAPGDSENLDALVMNAMLAPENFDWLVGYGKDNKQEMEEMAKYASNKNPESREKELLALADWIADRALSIPLPAPLDWFDKPRRYLSKKYRVAPRRYDPSLLRVKWEQLGEKIQQIKDGKELKGADVNAERKELEKETAILSSEAVEYWRMLFLSFSRCRAEEMAYEAEKSLISEGNAKEIVRYINDKKQLLIALRPAILRMIILAGGAKGDINSGNSASRVVQAFESIGMEFCKSYSPRQYRWGKGFSNSLIDLLSLPRGVGAESEFFSSMEAMPKKNTNSGQGVVDRIGAELGRRSEQLRFAIAWTVFVD